MKKRTFPIADFLISAVLIAFSVFIFWRSGQIPKQSTDVLSAGFFPEALSLGLLAATLIMLAAQIISSKKSNNQKNHGSFVPLVSIASLVAYSAAMVWIGFFASTLIFLSGMLWLLDEKRIVVYCAVPFGAALVVYVLFQIFLQVQLPAGPF